MIAKVMGHKGTDRASPTLARSLVRPQAQVLRTPIPTPMNDSPTTFTTREWEFPSPALAGQPRSTQVNPKNKNTNSTNNRAPREPERARPRALRWDSRQCVSAPGRFQIARPPNPSGRAPALGAAVCFAGTFFYVVRNRAAPRSPTGAPVSDPARWRRVL